MSTEERVLILMEGLSGLEQAKSLLLDEGTINFYPVSGGYLQNYPGRTDYYDRAKGDPGVTDGYGVPPSNALNYTRIFSFVDYLKVEHLVVVAGNTLYEVVGNGFVVLFVFQGKNTNGDCFPTMFVHESKLIVLNEGDFPMLWDGVDGITPLGVQEVPSPPVMVRNSHPWNVNFVADPYIDGNFWYHYIDEQVPGAGTGRTDSASAAIEGWYQTCVQYIDKYGNHGRASAPSSLHSVVNKNAGSTVWDSDSMSAEWEPPKSDEHIHFVRQGRTLTLNPDDNAPLGDVNVLFTEWLQEGTTQHRRWQRLSDGELANTQQIDLLVHGPPSSNYGCSFSNRVYLVDDDGNVWYSDLVLSGQFRASQQIVPYSKNSAIIPAGDRLFIIGHSSTEVWYESNAGPALLEQDIVNGSKYGSTFVAVGDGIVFGLWNGGFGFYDGKEHKFVPVPYYIEKFYLGEMKEATKSATKIKDWYYLTIRRWHVTPGNNVIIKFNFRTGRWFVVEETVNDIGFWNDEIVGVDDSVYVLFRGNTYAKAIIDTAGIVSGGLLQQRTVNDVRILMEPSSVKDITLLVSGETRSTEQPGTGSAMPLAGINQIDKNFLPYWNTDYTYGQDWVAPGDVFLQMSFARPAVGFYHKVRAEFEPGHLVRIKGLEIVYSMPQKPE